MTQKAKPEILEIPKAKFDALVSTKAKALAEDAVNKAKGEVTALRGELAGVQAKLAAAESNLTQTTNRLEISNRNVSRLEGFCDMKGVHHKDAVTVDHGFVAKTSAAAWEDRLAKATSATDRAKITREFEAAVEKGLVQL